MRVDPAYLRYRVQEIVREKEALGGPAADGRHVDGKRAERASRQEIRREEEALLQELRARDREVRAHEEAHLLAAGPYARSGPRFETVRGPDGREYAVSGEVEIDTTPVPGDPEETLEKARVVKRAALAPAHPSPQDLKVAAQADRLAQEALMELMKERLEAQISAGEAALPRKQTARDYGSFLSAAPSGKLDLHV